MNKSRHGHRVTVTKYGIYVYGLHSFCVHAKYPPSLALGYAALSETVLSRGIAELARCLVSIA